MSLRWLITGAEGMVGSDLRTALKERNEDTVAVGRAELDITDSDAVRRLAAIVQPSVIVNCAAFTRVDDCETGEERSTLVNGAAVANLAGVANLHGALLVQLSTDFVFSGDQSVPYEVNDPPGPVSAYGRGKLEGERAARASLKHIVLRTSWLFGANGWNFVEAIRKQVLGGNRELKVVDDQRGRPTFTPHLADAIIRLSRLGVDDPGGRGIFHYADQPEVTWFGFASAILALMQERDPDLAGTVIRPVTSDAFPRPARRPAYSVLSTSRYERVTGAAPDSWEEGLAEYLSQ